MTPAMDPRSLDIIDYPRLPPPGLRKSGSSLTSNEAGTVVYEDKPFKSQFVVNLL